ncbi:MAG: hypothetical protein KAW92_08175 [Candidatus Cloacimonetes bacterium]|nr:hypothetical protein [Candidatus Cloacimonadota bacterium]
MANNFTINDNKVKLVYEEIFKKISDYDTFITDENYFFNAVKEFYVTDEEYLIDIKGDVKISFSEYQFKLFFTDYHISSKLVDKKYFLLEKTEIFSIDEKSFNFDSFILNNKNNDKIGFLFYYELNELYNEEGSYFLYEYRKKLLSQNNTLTNLISPDMKLLFQNLFQPINYLLILNKGLCYKSIIYKIASIGLVESKKSQSPISLNREISDITKSGTNKIKFDKLWHKAYNSYKFYISALNNENIFYQYLDLYHVIESLFKDAVEIMDKRVKSSKASLYFKTLKVDEIGEEIKVRFVLSNLEKHKFTIVRELNKIDIDFIRKKYIKIPPVPKQVTNEFLSELGSFIYKIRNIITHRGEKEHVEKKINTIEDIKNFKRLNKFMFFLADLIFEHYEA